jgi:hypothetical protein
MATPTEGRNTIDYLLGRGRLERIDGSRAGESSATIIGRATRRLLTANGGLAAGDVEGAFAAAYDAYRMAAEALLIRQGLRTTGGEGSHVTVEDAVSGQFAKAIPGLANQRSNAFAGRATPLSISTRRARRSAATTLLGP